MEKRGYPSVGFDIEKSQYHDANSSCGLIGMVSGCGRLREGSLTHWDTPCSTWVFMCRAQTQRSLLEPEGPRPCTRIPCVDWAKQQVSRMAAMWLRLLALSCEFVLDCHFASSGAALDYLSHLDGGLWSSLGQTDTSVELLPSHPTDAEEAHLEQAPDLAICQSGGCDLRGPPEKGNGPQLCELRPRTSLVASVPRGVWRGADWALD